MLTNDNGSVYNVSAGWPVGVDGVLESKLHTPPLRAEWIDRSRLMDKIAEAVRLPVLLVAAPDDSGRLFIVDQVGAVRVVENGQLRPEPFHLTAMVTESISSVRALAEAKSIALETRLDVPMAIEADRLRVKQVLVNLLSNAVKFTPEGGRVSVEAGLRGTFVAISVTDTGVGIPPEEHASIFDKFYQVGATTKGVREGTGLGLAITRRLVEQHGGSIQVESQPNRGSRFTFTIPLRKQEQKAKA